MWTATPRPPSINAATAPPTATTGQSVDQDARRLGDVTTALYDAAGNTTTQIDALSHITTLSYDADNRLTQTHNALGGLSTVVYDAASNVLAQVDAVGPSHDDGLRRR